MTLMRKAAQGVTWHAVDTVTDFRLGACGEPLDLAREMHHSLVTDHLFCQRAACSSAIPQGETRVFTGQAGEATVAGLVLLAVVLFIAVLLGAVVPIAVFPWLAYGGLALFVSGCLVLPRRR